MFILCEYKNECNFCLQVCLSMLMYSSSSYSQTYSILLHHHIHYLLSFILSFFSLSIYLSIYPGNAKMAKQAQSKEKVLDKMLKSGLTG